MKTKNFLNLKSWLLMMLMLIGVGNAAWAEEGTIKFGPNGVKIDKSSVSAEDNLNNTWTITTVGTTSFTNNVNNDFSQVGSSSKPATSITFTTTLASDVTITSMEAKFSGFNGTAGDITLKVGDTTVGTGALNERNDVIVRSSTSAIGKDLTITVTNISKGVCVYQISYTYESSGSDTPTIARPTFSPASGAVKYGSTVSLAQADASLILYTTNGTTPSFENSVGNEYTVPIAITTATTIKAIAVDDDGNESEVASASYTIQAPQKPTFSPTPGEVEKGTTVTLSQVDGLAIRYTTNGDDPTIDSEEYTSPVTINESTTLKAVAVDGGGNVSAVVTAKYVVETGEVNYAIDFENALDTYNAWAFENIYTGNTAITAHGGNKYGTTANASGNGTASASITTKKIVARPKTLSCYISKVTNNTTSSKWYIEVSSDGENWTEVENRSATEMSKGSWVELSADLSLYKNVYVRIRYAGSTAIRSIDDVTLETKPEGSVDVSTPTFSVEEGTYWGAQNIEISCDTDGATIYYTLDGTEPTNESTEYTGAITISETKTLKAIAYVGNDASTVATATYTFPTIQSLNDLNGKEGGTYYARFNNAVVTYVNDKYAFIEEDGGAIMFYNNSNNSNPYSVGQVLNGVAEVTWSLYQGQPEATAINGVEGQFTGDTTTDAKSPTVVTLAQLSGENKDAYISRYIKVIKVAASGVSLNNSNYSATLTQGESTLAYYGRNAEVEEGGLYDIVGFLGINKGNYQLVAYSADDVEEIPMVAQFNGQKYESLQAAIDAAEAANPENIVIDLLDDAELTIAPRSDRLAIGTATTKSITINGNDHKLAFMTTDTDWNDVSTRNDDQTKLVLNDMTIDQGGKNTGKTWNSYDINFNCAVELNNVTSNRPIAFKNDATLNTVTISDTSGDYYGIWISPRVEGQNVSINGLNVTAGRGIKIDDQYVDAPVPTNLDIKNATFNTTSKAAILVKSKAVTDITVGENVNIENVAADKTNAVWVDEDYANSYGLVNVTGAIMAPESSEADYAAKIVSGDKTQGYYKTFAAAVAAAEADQVVTLLKDVETYELADGQTLTLDKNGHNITVSVPEGYVLNEDVEGNVTTYSSFAGIIINNVEELKAFRDAVNGGNQFAGKTVKLVVDLDLSGEENWTPIGNLVAYPGQSFDGVFDGNGHTIKNVTVVDQTPNHAVAGLFGSVVNGTIKNLTVENVNLTSSHYAGGIVAYTSNKPIIENCHVIGGTITSVPELVDNAYDNGDKVGGIMGYATAGSTINNCTVDGLTIKAYRDMGGIVGYSAGNVTNNTVKNTTIIQSDVNAYKDYEITTYDYIVGRNDGATLENNVYEELNNVLTIDGAVAKIGDKLYRKLQAAVDAAQQLGGAQTINLLDNISGETVTIKEVANFQLTIDGKKDAESNYTVDAQIIVDGLRGNGGSNTNGASVTLQNIAFVNNAAKDAILPSHYPHHLTIQNCSYAGSEESLNNWFVNVSDGPLYGATIKDVTVEHSRLIQGNLGLDVVFENIVATNDVKCGFNIKTEGTVLIKDCQVTTAKYAFRDYKEAYTGTITLEGNTFISTSEESDEGAIVNRGGAVGTGHINVVSGTYSGHIKVLNSKEGVLAISGGIFSESIAEAYCADGYICIANPDTETNEAYPYAVAPRPYVAQIGDVQYYSLAEAVAAVPADGTETTIMMIEDETIVGNAGVTIPTTKNVKLDLNGKTVTLSVTESKGSQLITNQGVLTITDSSEGQEGKLTNAAAEGLAVGSWPTNNYVTNIITNSGTLNVEGGNIVSTANGSICYAVDNNSSSYDATLNIKGGYLTSVGTVVRQFCNSTTKQNVVNVSGGTIETNGSAAIWTQLPGSDSSSKKLATLNITGGVVKAASYAWYDYSYGDSFEAVSYSISGGELYGYLYSYAVANGVIADFVSGGLFSKPVGAYYLADGLICAASEEYPGMYELVPAEIYYSWMSDGQEVGEYYAFAYPIVNNNLEDGEFITLLKNVTLTEDIACQLTEGSFNLTLGDYIITKGDYSVSLNTGVTVYTDKQTDIFSAAEAGYMIEEAEVDGGFTYTAFKVEVAAPIVFHDGGTYEEALTVPMIAQAGAEIYYSTDGTNFTKYAQPIEISTTTTVTAYAMLLGAKSSEVTKTFEIVAKQAGAEVADGYYNIKTNDGKFVNVAGRKTVTLVSDTEGMPGTVIRVNADAEGVKVLRSQGVDLPGYAKKAMNYVPEIVQLAVDKLHAEGAGELLGEHGLKAIMDKFDKSFDYNLYLEGENNTYRIYGKTPSMKPVVDFYAENKDNVDAKLPQLEAFINSAIDKVLQKTNGSGASILVDFELHKVWENMDGTLTEPVDEASTAKFYEEVLTSEANVWNFAYQTAMIYWGNLKNHPRFAEIQNKLGDYSKYIDKVENIRPNFRYYIVPSASGVDFISQGNSMITDASTAWTMEPVSEFTVNFETEQTFNIYPTTSGGETFEAKEYYTTLYTDFAYTLPEDGSVKAYKVTEITEKYGVAKREEITGVIPAQTPVLLVTSNEGAQTTLTLTTEAGTAVTGNLLVGADALINEYQIKTPQVVSLFDMAKSILGESAYETYLTKYEHLMLKNAGTVGNKYFFGLTADDLKGVTNLRVLTLDNAGMNPGFHDIWEKVDANKAIILTNDYNPVKLFLVGDVNRDGNISIADVTALVNIILGKATYPKDNDKYDFAAANVNSDNAITISDVTALVNIILGK